jgi:hypothetical protein
LSRAATPWGASLGTIELKSAFGQNKRFGAGVDLGQKFFG